MSIFFNIFKTHVWKSFYSILYGEGVVRMDIEFIRERLVLLKMLLSDKGSIYLHIDYKIGHYVKIVMDEIFGIENSSCPVNRGFAIYFNTDKYSVIITINKCREKIKESLKDSKINKYEYYD